MLADILTAADVLKEILGPHAHLGASRGDLADLIQGRLDLARPGLNPHLVRIGRMLAEGRAPSCRVVLLLRLASELRRDHPLNRNDPQEEGRLLERVISRLRDPETGELLGGAEVEEALSKRMLRHRQDMLRQIGLFDAVDALPGQWRPTLAPLAPRPAETGSPQPAK